MRSTMRTAMPMRAAAAAPPRRVTWLASGPGAECVEWVLGIMSALVVSRGEVPAELYRMSTMGGRPCPVGAQGPDLEFCVSGSDVGRWADCQDLDALRRVAPGLSQSARRPNPEPKHRSIVHIRALDALLASALFRDSALFPAKSSG